jgi:hypothetical protein
MAAAIAPGTPSPGSAEPAPSAESHGIDSILGDLTDVAEANDSGGEGILDALAGDEAAAPEAEATEETEPVNKTQRLDDDVIFSDEALATKEGVLKAKARALELRKLGHQKYLELKAFEKRVAKRHQKLQFQVEKYVNGKRNDELLLGNVRSNLQALHSNDPDSIITALGNLTGQDGLKAYELITSRIVNRGASKLDPQVQAVLDQQRQEIEQLKNGLTQRERAEEERQLTSQLSSHAQRIQQQVISSPTLPHLSRLMQDDPQHLTDFIVNEITKSNGKEPAAALYARLEGEIRTHFERSGVAPQGDGGGPAPKQPSTAQRSPGQSIGPRSTAAATQRVPSEDEALKLLAADPDFMSQFGL